LLKKCAFEKKPTNLRKTALYRRTRVKDVSFFPKKRKIQCLDALEVVLVLWNSKTHIILMLLLLWGEGGELLLLGPGELGGDQGVVQTLHLHQLVVGPLLNHLPILRWWGVRGLFLDKVENKNYFCKVLQ
jgi:hypothetical protein